MNTKFTILVRTMLVTILLVSGMLVKSQNTFLSLQITRDISGSGLGGNVCPNMALNFKKHTLSIGPNFQRRKMNFSGMQYDYRYSAAKGSNGKLELFFSGTVIKQSSAFLSKGSVEIETTSDAEVTRTCENMKLNVFECYAGIGLKINLTHRFNLACSSGIGMYHTCNRDYDENMYRQKSGAVMQMRLLLIYNFCKAGR